MLNRHLWVLRRHIHAIYVIISTHKRRLVERSPSCHLLNFFVVDASNTCRSCFTQVESDRPTLLVSLYNRIITASNIYMVDVIFRASSTFCTKIDFKRLNVARRTLCVMAGSGRNKGSNCAVQLQYYSRKPSTTTSEIHLHAEMWSDCMARIVLPQKTKSALWSSSIRGSYRIAPSSSYHGSDNRMSGWRKGSADTESTLCARFSAWIMKSTHQRVRDGGSRLLWVYSSIDPISMSAAQQDMAACQNYAHARGQSPSNELAREMHQQQQQLQRHWWNLHLRICDQIYVIKRLWYMCCCVVYSSNGHCMIAAGWYACLVWFRHFVRDATNWWGLIGNGFLLLLLLCRRKISQKIYNAWWKWGENTIDVYDDVV